MRIETAPTSEQTIEFLNSVAVDNWSKRMNIFTS